jgi:hypothetical protein
LQPLWRHDVAAVLDQATRSAPETSRKTDIPPLRKEQQSALIHQPVRPTAERVTHSIPPAFTPLCAATGESRAEKSA